MYTRSSSELLSFINIFRQKSATPVAAPVTVTHTRSGSGMSQARGFLQSNWVTDGLMYYAVISAFVCALFIGARQCSPANYNGIPISH